MKLNRMKELLRVMPRNSPYLTRVPGGGRDYGVNTEVDTWAYVRNDPDFGFMFVKSFCDLGKKLPDDVYETHLWRLYCFKAHGSGDLDHNMLEVCALTDPRMTMPRTIMECMLMHPGVKFEWIAKGLGYDLDVVQLYHELFFNVRDRMTGNDSAYLLSLVYPEGRQVEFSRDYHLHESWAWIAKRIAYNKGFKAMMQWLGGRNSESEMGAAEAMSSLEASIASGGKFAINCGFQHQQNVAALHAARQLLQSSKLGGQETSSHDMLEELSYFKGARASFNAFVNATSREQLQQQTIYDTAISVAQAKAKQHTIDVQAT